MKLVIKNARIIDPASGRDGKGDLYIADGKIAEEVAKPQRTIDAKGLVAAPRPLPTAAPRRGARHADKADPESAMAAILELVRWGGARVHICGLSTAGGVEMMRAAKREGLPVTCDVGIHHLHLCDNDLGYFDANCRLEPPLRSQRDRDALARGLEDGTVDCACSDHTPVDDDGKHLPFAEAEAGATGLELLLPLTR